jgi:hypothetical protein
MQPVDLNPASVTACEGLDFEGGHASVPVSPYLGLGGVECRRGRGSTNVGRCGPPRPAPGSTAPLRVVLVVIDREFAVDAQSSECSLSP